MTKQDEAVAVRNLSLQLKRLQQAVQVIKRQGVTLDNTQDEARLLVGPEVWDANFPYFAAVRAMVRQAVDPSAKPHDRTWAMIRAAQSVLDRIPVWSEPATELAPTPPDSDAEYRTVLITRPRQVAYELVASTASDKHVVTLITWDDLCDEPEGTNWTAYSESGDSTDHLMATLICREDDLAIVRLQETTEGPHGTARHTTILTFRF